MYHNWNFFSHHVCLYVIIIDNLIFFFTIFLSSTPNGGSNEGVKRKKETWPWNKAKMSLKRAWIKGLIFTVHFTIFLWNAPLGLLENAQIWNIFNFEEQQNLQVTFFILISIYFYILVHIIR